MNHTALFLLAIFCLCGCRTNEIFCNKNKKFDRLFCWGSPANENEAARFAAAGVTDLPVKNLKQYEWAKKYGMNAYWNIFLPTGPYKQVLTADEQKHYDYISGTDLNSGIPYNERMKILHQRRKEKQHLYGGDTVTEIATIANYQIACFSSDDDFTLTEKKLDNMLDKAPADAAGMFMDFTGYTNLHGCYCPKCLFKYQNYLKSNKLPDNAANRGMFYLEEIISYYNRVIDYVKSKRHNYKIVIHVYPLFKNAPLHGNRTKADYCGQTVSWYFKWDGEKIRKYTDYVIKHAKDYYLTAEGLPFIGLSTDKNSSLGYKTPEDIDFELRTILQRGATSVMVCNGREILKDGYFEVFKKYCAADKQLEQTKKH